MKRVAGVVACLLAIVASVPAGHPQAPVSATSQSKPLLAEAQDVARWLRGVAVPQGGALAWAGTPGPSAKPIANLYSGSCGVVLFFLELHHATRDARDLATARAGADWLLTQIESEPQAGLYTGLAGIGVHVDGNLESDERREISRRRQPGDRSLEAAGQTGW